MQANNPFDLNKFTTALANINLMSGGDSVEQDGAKKFGMDKTFFNYESFWKFHVVPATERPKTINSRITAAREIHQIGQISYSIFVNMYDVEISLDKVKNGDLGGLNFKNIMDVINYTGDAIQKIKNLQEVIERNLKKILGFQKLDIFPTPLIKTKWLADRKIVVSYRNTQTHNGSLAVIFHSNLQDNIVYMMDPNEVLNYFPGDNKVTNSDLTWQETHVLFISNPEKFLPVADVCSKLVQETYKWLNESYDFIINTLDPLMHQASYRALWGMTQADYDDIISYYISPKPIITVQSTSSSSFYIPGSGSGTYQV